MAHSAISYPRLEMPLLQSVIHTYIHTHTHNICVCVCIYKYIYKRQDKSGNMFRLIKPISGPYREH
jgi:hypothetical protein